MAISKTRTVINAAIAITGKGTQVFNDPMADGSRSVKVWGWGSAEYLVAKELLERAGLVAWIVVLPVTKLRKKPTVRVHVSEA
jgi:hypothetical protein